MKRCHQAQTAQSRRGAAALHPPIASYKLDPSPSIALLGTRGQGLRRLLPIAILIITIVAFTAAFFPHAPSLVTPSLLDIVQCYNIDNPIAELMTTFSLSKPSDSDAFITSLATRLGCIDPIVVSSAYETRLTTAHPDHDYTLSIRLHPVARLWRERAELQIALVSVHPGVLADVERQLRSLVRQIRPGEKIPVFVTISGSLPPERIERSQKDLITQVFASLDAQITEGISEERLESWTGYTTRLPDATKVRHNRLNLQMATRYASDANTVIIRIGTPLVVGTY